MTKIPQIQIPRKVKILLAIVAVALAGGGVYYVFSGTAEPPREPVARMPQEKGKVAPADIPQDIAKSPIPTPIAAPEIAPGPAPTPKPLPVTPPNAALQKNEETLELPNASSGAAIPPAPKADTPAVTAASTLPPAASLVTPVGANKGDLPQQAVAATVPDTTVKPLPPATEASAPATVLSSILSESKQLPKIPLMPAPPTPSSSSQTPPAQNIPSNAATRPSQAMTGHYPSLTLMFRPEEMDVITKIIKSYDGYDPRSVQKPKEDDLAKLVEAAPVVMPSNLYLGSILYYSPKDWTVRINGQRVSSANNKRENEFYVTRISRKQVELIWKPQTAVDIIGKWNQLTEGGMKPLRNVNVDSSNGTVTALMAPNQTLDINSLEIKEGLVKSKSILDFTPSPGEKPKEENNPVATAPDQPPPRIP